MLPGGEGQVFSRGLYTSAQYLERICNFWKNLPANPSGRGYFSAIAISRLILARHNQDRETHVAERGGESPGDPCQDLVLVPGLLFARPSPAVVSESMREVSLVLTLCVGMR